MKELSNEEVDRIAAEEIMGWRITGPDQPITRWYRSRNKATHYAKPNKATGKWWIFASTLNAWHPTTCRNQSRMVVEAAMEKMEAATAFGKCVNAHMIAECFERAGYLPKICANVEFAYLTPREETVAAILAIRASKGEEPT